MTQLTIPKTIKSPADVEALIESMGYNKTSFLGACGVNVHTFQDWKKKKSIPNQSALILFNLMSRMPDVMGELKQIGLAVNQIEMFEEKSDG